VGGIRFFKPVKIGDLVKVDAKIVYTGNSSMHIAIDVSSKNVREKDYHKTTHCIIVFVAVDDEGKTTKVPKWLPVTDREKQMEAYAVKLMGLRKNIEEEMRPFMEN
jgi:acyl-CoA hydrolase